MDLFLIRHAIAEERREGFPDAERTLTKKGRARFELMVRDLDRAGLRFDCVYHSPWLRAAQTAELLAPINDGRLVAVEGLAQPPEPELFASLEGERVACVGHEPWMSDAVALLTTGNPDGTWLHVKKGGIAWLRGSPTPASMQLRALWGHSPTT
jgi:phosphohistidine phosphatase